MTTTNKWPRRFLGLAHLVATWSKDISTGVGAVITDEENRIVSLGFNGFPRGVHDSDEHQHDREEKLRRTIHAEDNAILFARGRTERCTIYVTHPPCARCAAKIIQSGIIRVVCRAPWQEFRDRWQQEISSAEAMFREAGVIFEYIEGNL